MSSELTTQGVSSTGVSTTNVGISQVQVVGGGTTGGGAAPSSSTPATSASSAVSGAFPAAALASLAALAPIVAVTAYVGYRRSANQREQLQKQAASFEDQPGVKLAKSWSFDTEKLGSIKTSLAKHHRQQLPGRTRNALLRLFRSLTGRGASVASLEALEGGLHGGDLPPGSLLSSPGAAMEAVRSLNGLTMEQWESALRNQLDAALANAGGASSSLYALYDKGNLASVFGPLHSDSSMGSVYGEKPLGALLDELANGRTLSSGQASSLAALSQQLSDAGLSPRNQPLPTGLGSQDSWVGGRLGLAARWWLGPSAGAEFLPPSKTQEPLPLSSVIMGDAGLVPRPSGESPTAVRAVGGFRWLEANGSLAAATGTRDSLPSAASDGSLAATTSASLGPWSDPASKKGALAKESFRLTRRRSGPGQHLDGVMESEVGAPAASPPSPPGAVPPLPRGNSSRTGFFFDSAEQASFGRYCESDVLCKVWLIDPQLFRASTAPVGPWAPSSASRARGTATNGLFFPTRTDSAFSPTLLFSTTRLVFLVFSPTTRLVCFSRHTYVHAEG